MLRASSYSSTTAQPTLPPLPEPPIFDSPHNPYIGSLLSGTFPAFHDLTPEQVYQAQLQVVETILHEVKKAATNLSLTLSFVWLCMLITCGLLLFRIRRNRQSALRGDAEAARKIVLPAFEPLLWLLCTVNVLYIVTYGMMLASNDYLVYLTRVSIEFMYAGKQFNFMLVPIFMQQQSLSLRALGRAVLQCLLMSIYTVPIVWVLNTFGTPSQERVYYWMLIGARSPVLFYFAFRFVFPPARASVQTMREFCGYIVTMMLLVFAAGETFRNSYVRTATTLGWAITIYSACLPIFVWRVLRADTEHWRGIGKRAVELQAVFRRKNAKVDERVSSQGLHVLIEMHRKFIIDFAHLQLHEAISGASDSGSATVYRGYLHTKKVTVAVKMYMPTNFTEETVAEFSHEAALCGSLVHPNILRFHGLCVCPPNICLVTELCQGSLQDVAQVQVNWSRQGVTPRRRQQLVINIGYMLDAARAVAYLHSFSPAFVHRDIKPSNFLVDDEGNVKLTDFGASRTLAVRSNSGHQHQPDTVPTNKSATERNQPQQVYTAGRVVFEVPGVVASTANYTAQYMAPEVIKGHHAGTVIYGEAADIYSLAMTMWDILHPGMAKYQLGSTAKTTSTFRRGDYGPERDLEVFELVFAGERPMLDPHMHRGLRELLETAWHADPRNRPSAQNVVSALESIQEEICATFALELMDELNERKRMLGAPAAATRPNPQVSLSSFAGTQVVEKLRICEFVDSQSEAIRLGNMLMDSGFVHHVKHARSFEYSGSQYFFDEDHIMLCQPMVMMDLEDESGSASHGGNAHISAAAIEKAQQLQRQKLRHEQHSNGSSYRGYGGGGRVRVGSHSSHVLMEHRCACRRLGQRAETERTTRRRFRRKFKMFTDENLLTAKLLTDDEHHNSATRGDFTAFRDSALAQRGVGDAA